jgi:hypothetical protein
MSPQQKLSVLYYLLLDYDDSLGPRSQIAEKLASKTGLPAKYQILMKGLWHMDRLQFSVRPERDILPTTFAYRPIACA